MELTGTNRPTQTTTPTTTILNRVSGTVNGYSKWVGGRNRRRASTIRSTTNPTQPTRTRDAYATRRVRAWGAATHNTTKSSYRVILALPAQSSRWSQRQGNARHPSRTRKLSLTAPMVLHPPGCGRVGHHRAHTSGIGSAFTNDVKADPILLLLLFAQRQGAYALLRYEIRRVRSRALRATPVLPGLATPMA